MALFVSTLIHWHLDNTQPVCMYAQIWRRVLKCILHHHLTCRFKSTQLARPFKCGSLTRYPRNDPEPGNEE
ncbi:Uncharacterized protein APZ42_009863 [Daphnia magna]|uniref:Uncharacterized protein n=1 Tax=Daphnia magna TaxID=35525 RepID=A0A164DR10_9CRUS|nr:Uncharacterized protein APZ42_009863 [Daphnia magna]